MKRLKMAVLVLGLSPLLMGAGGGAQPPIPGQEQIANLPRFNAVITVDTHDDGVTTTAVQGSVTVYGRGLSTTGPIAMNPFTLNGVFTKGCITDQATIESRFINVRLVDIMPSRRAVIELMAPHLAEVSFETLANVSLASPIITLARFPRCAGPFEAVDAGVTGPGIQIFDAQLKLVVPAH